MTRLILLSLLMKKNLYGYEIKKIIQEKYMHFTRVSVSSIYSTLDILLEKGFINKREKKVGNRPERHIYHITQEGKQEYRKLLNRTIRKESTKINLFDPFNLPFSLMSYIDKKESLAILGKRKNVVDEKLDAMENHVGCVNDLSSQCNNTEMDVYILMLIKRGIAHLIAEKKWLEETIDALQKEQEARKEQAEHKEQVEKKEQVEI